MTVNTRKPMDRNDFNVASCNIGGTAQVGVTEVLSGADYIPDSNFEAIRGFGVGGSTIIP